MALQSLTVGDYVLPTSTPSPVIALNIYAFNYIFTYSISRSIVSICLFAVKPYIPYDIVPSNLPLPMMYGEGEGTSTEGHAATANNSNGVRYLSVPSWIYEADVPLRKVIFSEQSVSALKGMEEEKLLHHCASAENAQILIEEVCLFYVIIIF